MRHCEWDAAAGKARGCCNRLLYSRLLVSFQSLRIVMKKRLRMRQKPLRQEEAAGSQVPLSFFTSLRRPVISVFYLPDLSGSVTWWVEQVAGSSQGLKIYRQDISTKKRVCCVFSVVYVPCKYLERNHQNKHLVVCFISVRCHCSTAAVGGSREGGGAAGREGGHSLYEGVIYCSVPSNTAAVFWECCRLFIGPRTLLVVCCRISRFCPARVDNSGSRRLLCF